MPGSRAWRGSTNFALESVREKPDGNCNQSADAGHRDPGPTAQSQAPALRIP
jgi:hypothetical protein